MKRLGFDASYGRDLFLLDLIRPAEVATKLEVSARRFVALVAWDSTAAPTQEITRFVESLLRAGCVYVCAWGEGCERLHDLVDEVELALAIERPNGAVVMTTSHADESLDDALCFLLSLASPDEGLDQDCDAAVVVCIGQDPARLARARFALENHGAFLDEVRERDS